MDNSVGNTGFVDDWQANKSVTERNWYMLENSISTDVTFSVSNDALDDDNGMFFFCALLVLKTFAIPTNGPPRFCTMHWTVLLYMF